MNVVLDDRLLIEEILVGSSRDGVDLHTTGYWYFRACRAAELGAGGHLSGPFRGLPALEQRIAIDALLHLPDDIEIVSLRDLVPFMVDTARSHPQLNIVNIEVVAAARALGAVAWLSPPSATGVLQHVLDDYDLRWEIVATKELK